MKKFYAILPKDVAKKVRRVIEFDSGITETILNPAKAGVDKWNPLTEGSPQYRPAPGSIPRPVLPKDPFKTYDIKYYSRDVRRNEDKDMVYPIENNFVGKSSLLLDVPKTVENPQAGSPGNNNPDVYRYDNTGLRSAMSATWPALDKSLLKCRPTHQPHPSWGRRRVLLDTEVSEFSGSSKPLDYALDPKSWQRTRINEW